MGYASKTFMELIDWLFIRYGKITPVDLLNNKDTVQALYHFEDPIGILFDQIETGQEFAIAGNLPFSNRWLEDM